MPKITLPAARVTQGALTLYTTSMQVRDLVKPDFYSVERLDPENEIDKGYQRVLNTGRAKKLADYIVRGQESRDAFLPTSVLLATAKSIEFNEAANTIDIDTSGIGPFSVVDGQHRLEGLKVAAEKDPRVLDFQIPVNIAINLPFMAQMAHFYIVNTTQKSVDQSVEQRIISRLTQALNVEEMPRLPKWIERIVEKGEVDHALKLVIFLNEADESPWNAKVRMANDSGNGTTINQHSFEKSVKKYILTANNPISVHDPEKQRKIFLNYWCAIANLIHDGKESVLFKTIGVELFCKFSTPFFNKLLEKGDFKIETMKHILSNCFENVDGEYAGVGHSQWWTPGSKASGLNSSAVNQVFHKLCEALHKASMTQEIEL